MNEWANLLYGSRIDGTAKGRGFHGPLKTNDGEVMTELSAHTTLPDGRTLVYPLITPNQGFKDLSNVLTGGQPTPQMHEQAYLHALSRHLTGQSPFANPWEEK